MAPGRSQRTAGVLEREARTPAPEQRFEVARSLDDVLEAWGLLYEAYVRVGFISPNPFELHAVPQAIGPHTLVMLGHVGEGVVSTISGIVDNPRGLPLDSVYPEELDALRAQGRKLIEVGLFGDRRILTGEADRTIHAIFELMRYTYYFGAYLGATDFVCGIPPRRARLYSRAFGFRPVGEVKSYATVEDNPVQLLHAETAYARENYSRHRALAYFIENPISDSVFEGRFHFEEEQLAGSRLEGYLEAKSAAH